VTSPEAAPAPVPDAVRQAVGQFATGIAVVATSTNGVTHALAVSAFTSVSLDPLLVLVCVDRADDRHDPVIAAGTWAVSILSEEHQPAARRLTTRAASPGPGLTTHSASPGPGLTTHSASPGPGLNGHPHRPGPVTGHPVLADALASLECRTYAVHPGGDHTILIGQVLSVAGPEASDVPGPLLLHAGRYRRLPDR
jgi:flavin reductase (DIM6/NTAB) family NADH-FMN oxidoreductase RutF